MARQRRAYRVSQHYKLGRTQPTLDFVDVDINSDTPVFIDPRALRLLHSPWADECTALVQHFFRHVLRLIRRGYNKQARNLLSMLAEPNETHLGLSRGKSRGHALGSGSAADVWESLSNSEAAKTGLLEDLEDTILMVKGISSDIVSDITTNLIREPLISYTHRMAAYYGIPLVPDVNSGPIWDPGSNSFNEVFVSLPMTPSGKLLLVPKIIVRQRMDYDPGKYFTHYLINHMRAAELSARTELVKLLKTGKQRVTKNALIEKYGSGKDAIVTQTRRFPAALEEYRRAKRQSSTAPLDHLTLAASEETPPPDWDALLNDLSGVPAGRPDAGNYEKSIESLLTALFYPSLANPQVQREIHDGRKRIDITYTNAAASGFFLWLGQHYAAPHLFVECKNYSGDPANPELDQLSGRFSPSRGQVGILVCRRFDNKDLFLQRCRDTADDQRGFIIALDDADLANLVDEQRAAFGVAQYDVLRARFEQLVF